MDNIIFTQLSILELRQILRQELEACFETQKQSPDQPEATDKLLTVPQAAEFLSLAVPTVYSLISKGELPCMKRSKRVYFSRSELMDYLKTGRKKSNTEIQAQADQYLNKKK